MNRHYTIEQFKEIVKKLKIAFPLCSISTDIIVGFKGETEEEFENTVQNLKEIEFSFMHIFPYSERSGTMACKLPNPVPKEIANKRVKVLQELNKEFKNKFYSANLNKGHNVLIEEVDREVSSGYTDNYIYTYIDGKYEVGDIVQVKLTKPYLQGMKAIEIKKEN